MSYLQGVRIYAGLESIVFLTLIVVWQAELDPTAKTVLGWVHGFGWIALCLLVAYGYVRKLFPGTLLAATVSPAGPLGALVGFEILVRSRRRAGRFQSDVPAERSERAHAVPDPSGSGAGGGAPRGGA